jgi:hypothetical protein
MDTILVGILALATVSATVLIHYELVGKSARLIDRLGIPNRRRILAVIAVILLAHFLEICCYAVVFFGMHSATTLGSIGGDFGGGALDFFYFSISNFTTLGIGDLAPLGHVKLITGVEALNGLVLIGWSASFTYLSLQKRWDSLRI